MLNLFINNAWSQTGGTGGGTWVSLLPLILLIVIFYFILIRPQQKRAKEHKQMVGSLTKGDEIVTNGGLLGKIVAMDDNFLSLEIADGIIIKVQRMAISQMMPKGTVKSAK